MKENKWGWLAILLFIGLLFTLSVDASVSTSDIEVTLLTQYPDPAKAGDVMELRINVKNAGGASAENIIVEFVPDFPFSLVPGENARREIEDLPNWPKEGNFKTLLYKVLVNRDALEGQHKIKVRYSINGGIAWVEESFNIDVTSKEFAEIIYIDKTKLIPGQETEMVFTINNIGNAPLQNLVFSWNEPNNVVLPVNTDNTRYIKYLAPGEQIPLKYTVIASVNAEPDLYRLNLNLEYDIKNESSGTKTNKKETISTQAGVFVGGETDFDVAFSESSNGETSFSVANIGSNPAYSVSVIIPEQPGWGVSGSNTVIIGNLNKGDYTVASFKLQSPQAMVSDKSSSKGFQSRNVSTVSPETLQIQIAYTDTMGKRNTVKKEIPLNPQSLIGGQVTTTTGKAGVQQQGFFSKYKWYIITLIVLVFASVVYFDYKKKKASNQNLTLGEYFKDKKRVISNLRSKNFLRKER